MNKLSRIALSLCAVAALSLPALAQTVSNAPVLPGETALEYAERINACNGAEVLSAEFEANEANTTRLLVRCAKSLSGGLGAAAAGVPLLLILALAGDSSSSTTTSTSGTN